MFLKNLELSKHLNVIYLCVFLETPILIDYLNPRFSVWSTGDEDGDKDIHWRDFPFILALDCNRFGYRCHKVRT